MNILGKIFSSLLLTAYLAVMLLLLCAAYSDHISPLTTVYPAFLGLGFPFVLAVALVLTVIVTLGRRWIALAGGIIVILICEEPIVRYIPVHNASNPPEGKTIKLLTYNTCGFGQNAAHSDGRKILAFIKEQDPDIVCLQEFTMHGRVDGLNERNVRGELRQLPYYYYCPSNSDAGSGLAIFSRYPISKRRRLNYESLYNNSCYCDVEIDGQTLTLFNNHLESNQLSKEDREFYNLMLDHLDSEMIKIMRSTLLRKLARAYRVRAEQADTLRATIDQQTNPVIVCGDFNDTPISYAYRHVRGDDLQDAYRDTGRGIGITYHENRFLFRIDHILHSPQFKASQATVHHVNYSDHYPVTTLLTLPPKPTEEP